MIKLIKSVFLLFIFVLAGGLNSSAQTPVSVTSLSKESDAEFPIFSYGDEKVYSDEFIRVFNKNKRDDASPTKAEIEEYLELYTKFKLKVTEAYTRQMDTVPAFITELAGYRKKLAQPYLTDKTVTERLVKEAYDRSQMEVKASHLLINCALDALPSDTIAAYNKIMGLRNQIVEDKKPFAEIAEAFSEDPSAKSNKGDLGYFTAFQMIYPFENAAFTTAIGSVSMPIRTQFGYHLVNVYDKRKSIGDVKVAHLMVKYYNEAQVDSTRERIAEIYEKLKSGADWDKTVEEFSEDFNTNSKGGELTWFNRTTSNIPVEFKDVAFTLKKNGDFSEPVKTQFGWHILKRLDARELPKFEETKDVLRRKVERDSRSELNKDVVVSRIKVENKYKEQAGLSDVKNTIGDDITKGSYKKQDGSGTVLFTIDGKKYDDNAFFEYLAKNQSRSRQSKANVIASHYDNFVKKSNLDYEESILERKYDDFKYIMQEYKDGILLFELTDKEVWSKAVEDSVGLAQFYEKNKTNYMWGQRVDAAIFSCKNAKIAKKAQKQAAKGISAEDIAAKCNAKDPLALTLELGKFEKGQNTLLDGVAWKKGTYPLGTENDRVKFVRINEVLEPSMKPLKKNMGQATSDYQNHLESLWIDGLKKKYPLYIYKENVKKLYN